MEIDIDIDYSEIEEVWLIYALYHHTSALGLGHFHDKQVLSMKEAQEEFERYVADENGFIYIDYFFGKPLKLEFDTKNKRFNPCLYDRHAGAGMPEEVVARVRLVMRQAEDYLDKGIGPN